MSFVRPAAAALFLQKNFGIIFIEKEKEEGYLCQTQ